MKDGMIAVMKQKVLIIRIGKSERFISKVSPESHTRLRCDSIDIS